MTPTIDYSLTPIGFIQSAIKDRKEAPRQGHEGAPNAWLALEARFTDALEGLKEGQEIILITWFHQSRRKALKVHPRGDKSLSPTGVFATRSPDRPNPIGLHRVEIFKIMDGGLEIGPLEAFDGTPVIDIKPVLSDE